MKFLLLLFVNTLVGTHITALVTSRFQHQYQDLQLLRAALENEITRADITPTIGLTIKEQAQREYQQKASTAEESCTLPLLKNASISEIVKVVIEYYKKIVSKYIDSCGFQNNPGSFFNVVATIIENCIDRVPDPKPTQKMIKQFRFYADIIGAFVKVAQSTGNFQIPDCIPKTASYSSAHARRVLNRNAWMARLQYYRKAAASYRKRRSLMY